MPVWVLYGFLVEPIPPDLIPSFALFACSGMGLAVIFVMGLASAICWPINELILVPIKRKRINMDGESKV